jgi:hypothetical protein
MEQQIRQIVLDQLNAVLLANQTAIEEFEEIKKLLIPHNGKRITTHLQKKLPEGMALQTSNDKVRIMVAATGNDHAIARTSNKTICIERLEEINTRYTTSARERIKKLNAILHNPEKLERCIRIHTGLKLGLNQLTKAAEELKQTPELDSFENPAANSILKELGISYLLLQNIKCCP